MLTAAKFVVGDLILSEVVLKSDFVYFFNSFWLKLVCTHVYLYDVWVA